MSRSYRIAVCETLRRVIHAADHVTSALEILDVLPAEQMADLLAAELEKLGFDRDGDELIRADGDITVTVNVLSGQVVVRSELSEEVDLTQERSGLVPEEMPRRHQAAAEARLKELAKADLENQAAREEQELNRQATESLARHLSDIRSELDGAVNRATAAGLKQKAAQLGQIKEVTEDAQSGSLKIVIEV